MSRRNQEFTQNFASDGKRPLGMAPRIGLSRNVRPSPKQFKSPLLSSPVKYPNYNNTPNKFLDDINLDQTLNVKDIPLKKTLRERNKVKKNLRNDFDEDATDINNKVEHTDACETKGEITPMEVITNKIETEAAGTTKLIESKILKKPLLCSTNKLNIDSLLHSPVLTKDLAQDNLSIELKDSENKCEELQKITSQVRAINRKACIKSNSEDGKNVQKSWGKGAGRSKNINALNKSPSKDDKKDIAEITDELCASNNIQLQAKRKSRKKVVALVDDINEKNESIKITPLNSPTTPEYIIESRTRSANKKSPGCPVLTPQVPVTEKKKGRSKKTKKAVRKIMQNDRNGEGDTSLIPNKIPKLQREEPCFQKRYDKVDNTTSKPKAASKKSIDSDDVPLSEIQGNSLETSRDGKSIKKQISLSLRKSSASSIKSISENSVATSLDVLQWETVKNEVINFTNDIEEKEKKILSITENKNVRIAELTALTKQWEDGGKRALLALLHELTRSGENVDMAVLLKKFKAPECIKFDPFQHDFV